MPETLDDVVTKAEAACDAVEQYATENGWTGMTRQQAITLAGQTQTVQTQLDAANATITQLNADKTAMQAKIDAKNADIDAAIAADAAEDAALAKARQD